MNTELKKDIDCRIQKIANVLILNASFTENLGLLNGKFGISIFFFHYAQYSNNNSYEIYAGELIDEIYAEISNLITIDFANGLTGIGWGIEYLVKNGFLEADTDEVLEEIDNIIFRNRLQRPILLNCYDELFGYGFYYLARLLGKEQDNDSLNTLLKKDNLIYLVDECERLLINQKYIDFQMQDLSANTINSLVYFLLEVQKLKLFPTKVEKIIRYLISNFSSMLSDKTNFTDNTILIQFIENIYKLIPNEDSSRLIQNLINGFSYKDDMNNDVLIVNEFIKITWSSLLYHTKFDGLIYESLSQKAIRIAIDENYWEGQLTSLNKNNLGLNMGLAGLGLGLINEGIRLMHNLD